MINKKLLIGSMIAVIATLAIPTGIAHSSACSIIGTAGNDNISGTDDSDCIDGLAGNDKIQSGDSGDFVIPGDGADRVNTGDGDDFIVMTDDDAVDRVNCGDGDDTVIYLGAADPDDVLHDCETVRTV